MLHFLLSIVSKYMYIPNCKYMFLHCHFLNILFCMLPDNNDCLSITYNSMASSKLLRETVGDVTECPICTEMMVDPRVLPCIHTFCFKCLDQLWKDKQPGVKVPCPLCRGDVVIPVDGVSSLPKNFFVEKLVGAQKLSNSENTTVMCDNCLANGDQETNESVSEKFCVECKQHLCNKCLTHFIVL